jgi:hypothetical protein
MIAVNSYLPALNDWQGDQRPLIIGGGIHRAISEINGESVGSFFGRAG